MQKAWYDASGLKEPDRVRRRRETIGPVGTKAAPARNRGDSAGGSGSQTRRGQSAAELIRKGLTEGSSTGEIVAVVKAFHPDSKVDGKMISFYRHQLRKAGELPARIARTA